VTKASKVESLWKAWVRALLSEEETRSDKEAERELIYHGLTDDDNDVNWYDDDNDENCDDDNDVNWYDDDYDVNWYCLCVPILCVIWVTSVWLYLGYSPKTVYRDI
jgi:hypothetical protein